MATRTGERSGGTRTRRADAPVPVRSPEFDHLDLERLREYRKALTAEETRISYWRRLVQARLDLTTLGVGPDHIRLDQLQMALSETRVGLGRLAHLSAEPSESQPPLPDLGGLWSRDVATDDPAALELMRDELQAAESQLSAFRAALHDRLDRATTELIARYREDPTLALRALPLGPEPRSA
jgi:hypothetical protein